MEIFTSKLDFMSKKSKSFFTVIFTTFFCRRSWGSRWKLLLPFPPLLRRRLCSWLGLFGSRLLVLGDWGRGSCQAQQGFHLNTPGWQNKELHHWRAMLLIKNSWPTSVLIAHLSEFIGLQRGFRLHTRTYSLLLTVSKNFTYTLWYMVLASPKYPRYYT